MTPCSAVGLLLILLVSTCCVSSAAPLSRGSSVTQPCLGEFEYCPSSGACVLFSNLCSVCGSGQYLCPDGSTCVQGAAGYLTCPNLKGTHLDWTLPLDQRVQYIVNAANQSEMISQLTNDAPAIQRLGIPAYNWLNDDEHGVMGTKSTMFPNGCSLGASWDAELLKSVGYAIGLEARGLHNGYVHSGNRGKGQNGAGITMYAPNMNTVRDPRWGRAQEVYSEDPYLSSRLTFQFVTAGQEQNGSEYWMAAACCKHYVAYDLETLPVPRYYFDAQVDVRNMWETYMPVFHACVKEAQGAHVMCSYNAVNGVPTCADPRLLTNILRQQWGWNGFVVSDYDAWAQIYETHRYCPDYECAAAAGINAGMDQEGGGTIAVSYLPQALADGKVTNATLSQAFGRLMRVRIQLGMLDPPTLVPWNTVANDTSVVVSAAHLALARQAGREGMCLYKNNRDILPLSLASVPRVQARTSSRRSGADKTATKPYIALIGPQAPQEMLLLGNYALYPDAGVVSVVKALVEAVGQNVTANCSFEQDVDYYQPGQPGIAVYDPEACCYLCSVNTSCHFWTFYAGSCYLKSTDAGRVSSPGRVSGSCASEQSIVQWQPGCNDVKCEDTTSFAAAIALASSAEITIVMLGLDQSLESEGMDRSQIELPEGQQQLVTALRSVTSGRPLIGVLVHGGAIALQAAESELDVILDAWYPGMQGGYSIVDVLFGAYSPAGRTPVTWYQSSGQLPPPGTTDLYAGNGSLGLTYRYFAGQPLYPFGYGLSYSSFEYSNLSTDKDTYAACDSIAVTFSVQNTGSFTSDEVMQVYITQPDATVPVPDIRLAAFTRASFPQGSPPQTFTLQISPEYRSAVYDSDVYQPNLMIETGRIGIYVGGGQPKFIKAPLSTTVFVTSSAPLSQCGY